MEQVVQIITTTLDHTMPQSLTIVTQGLQLLNLAIIEVVDLHQLISPQEIEAVLDQEAHHLQVDLAEAAAALPEVKEVVHRLNQEEGDKPIFIDYHKKETLMKQILLVLVILMSFSIQSKAQTEEDALRYSSLDFGGTARYNSVAGAFGALGADLSVLSVNPAGMARFKTSEWSITPQIGLQNSSTQFMGTNATNGHESFVIGNIGIVGVIKAGKESASLWKSIQFGLSYNRLANFNERTSISGISDTSMSYVFAAQAGGIHPNEIYESLPFTSGLAYDAYVIDPGDSSGKYYTTEMYQGAFNHQHTITRKGHMGETALAISGNFNNKIYIGGTIGFPTIRFRQEKNHTETALSDSLKIENFTYNEFLTTRGNGINAKLGIIILPTKWLRIGAAYHTPTKFYYMKDNWSSSMSSKFKDGETYSSNSPDGSFLYTLRTPGRLIGSLSVIIARKAMISADYEYIDYAGSALSSHPFSGSSYNFSNENNTGDINFRATHNLRIGSEIKIAGPVYTRVGFSYYQNPYNPIAIENNDAKLTYTGGLGYRVKSFYIDFAVTGSTWTKDYYMYDPILVENTPIKKSNTNLIFTFGRKF